MVHIEVDRDGEARLWNAYGRVSGTEGERVTAYAVAHLCSVLKAAQARAVLPPSYAALLGLVRRSLSMLEFHDQDDCQLAKDIRAALAQVEGRQS